MINDAVAKEAKELRRKGLKAGENFIVRRGKLYIYDIPRSKMQKANELRWEGVPIEEISAIIKEDAGNIQRWFDR